MDFNMKKRILITGASKGIGKEITLELAKNDQYQLIIHYKSDVNSANEVVKKINSNSDTNAYSLAFDISNRDETKQALENDILQNGAYYGIVYNAGIVKDASFPMMDEQEWDSVINTNLSGFYNVVKPCILPLIQKRIGGRIIVMSSVSGIMGNRGQVNYSASKAGLIGAAKSLAIEVAKRNITVNCIAPGLIDTGMISEEITKHALPLIPMQRLGKPEEVAYLVDFLLSEKSSYITRQVLSVNGGMI